MRVVFVATPDGTLLGVDAEGHAFAAKQGRDLVCAAVSVLLQSLWLGLTQVLALRVDGEWASGRLHVRVKLEDARRSEVGVLFATTQCSLEALAAQYPRYLSMRLENTSSK